MEAPSALDTEILQLTGTPARAGLNAWHASEDAVVGMPNTTNDKGWPPEMMADDVASFSVTRNVLAAVSGAVK